MKPTHFQLLTEEQWNFHASALGAIPFHLKEYYEKLEPEKQSYYNYRCTLFLSNMFCVTLAHRLVFDYNLNDFFSPTIKFFLQKEIKEKNVEKFTKNEKLSELCILLLKSFLNMYQKKKNVDQYLRCLDEAVVLLDDLSSSKQSYLLKCFFDGELNSSLPKNQLQKINFDEFVNSMFNSEEETQHFYSLQFTDQQLLAFALSTTWYVLRRVEPDLKACNERLQKANQLDHLNPFAHAGLAAILLVNESFHDKKMFKHFMKAGDLGVTGMPIIHDSYYQAGLAYLTYSTANYQIGHPTPSPETDPELIRIHKLAREEEEKYKKINKLKNYESDHGKEFRSMISNSGRFKSLQDMSYLQDAKDGEDFIKKMAQQFSSILKPEELNIFRDLSLHDDLVTKFSEDSKNFKQCNVCSKITPTLKKCSRCKKVNYCSVECQKEDWKIHKKTCQ
jgi:hypothetical protein